MDVRFPEVITPFLKYVGSKPITAESSLHDLGLDSMRAIELLFAIEDTYGVSMPDELLTDATFATAGSLWAAIESLGPRTEQAS